MKSTVDEIRQRFDADVERFSNLETGQSATVDAALAMALVAEAAAATTPHARHVLDVGCGAGNYTLRLLEQLPNLDVTLIDLSGPMLDRATERLGRATTGTIKAVQGDIREIDLLVGQFDIVLAAAVLHHLRTDAEWRNVFAAFHRTLRPGGSVWVFDLVESSIPAVQQLVRRRYGEYLTRLRDEAYRDYVFAYVEKEDTPRTRPGCRALTGGRGSTATERTFLPLPLRPRTSRTASARTVPAPEAPARSGRTGPELPASRGR
jgi:tRNA (cmo5U34)-methyltransferase